MATKQRTPSPKPKIRRYDEGGLTEEDYKQRGLEASKGDVASFLDRMKAGNIDEPGSEAYNRWGAGYGRLIAEKGAAPKSAEPKAEEPAMDDTETRRRFSKAPNAAPAAEAPKPATKKPEAKQPYKMPSASSPDSGSRPGREKQGGPTYDEKPKSAWDDDSMLPGGGSMQKPTPPALSKFSKLPMPSGNANAGERNASNWDAPLTAAERKQRDEDIKRQALEESHPEQVFMPMGSLKGLHGLAKAMAGTSKAAPQAAAKAGQLAENITPVTFLGRSGGRQAAQEAERLGAKAASPRLTADSAQRVAGSPGPRGLPQPPRQLPAPERVVPKRAGISDREAWMQGPRGPLGNGQGRLDGMKKGGAVKGYAKGGVVRASSRADGIAQRGKTRGKIT